MVLYYRLNILTKKKKKFIVCIIEKKGIRVSPKYIRLSKKKKILKMKKK
jgi:hypothetical protein